MVKEFDNLFIERKDNFIPELPFLEIKNKILGAKYNLNIIFCSPVMSRDLNNRYRSKDYATNILSFALADDQGEIYIQLACARSDAKKHNMSYNKFIHLLTIHGCLHLKHHQHGHKMDSLEDKYLKMFYTDIKVIKKNEAKGISKHNRD